ncbi:MAG: response regulator transcription factor [Alphaproteobacteria bacterium]|nr:MAG: response regulator transcription factor [Alphaproteobacteria bacterium]
MRILLIEDEEMLGTLIREGLETSHYQVTWERNGEVGLQRAREEEFAVILLDIMLPGLDGWTICRRLRESKNRTPILMMTARDDVDDRVRGLELGADDYLPKPFEFKELRARIRALMRRERVHRGSCMRVADIEVDTVARRVTVAGRVVALTAREYSLLEALVAYEGQILSQERILSRVWDDEGAMSNTVEVYVSMLRKKIDVGRSQKLIQTVRGLGYTLRAPEEPIYREL